ncbi:MAG: two-component sensor histidine kinase [Desulfobacter sp.]|nr:MAG: two-component sensor histidine kinase [Desulfobacter sp.]
MDNHSNRLKQSRQRLKRGILINMIFLPMIPFIIVTGLSFYFFSSTLEDATRARLERILTDHRRMIESFLMNRKADLELVARIYAFDDMDSDRAVTAVYRELEERSPAFVDLGLFDHRGNHLRYAGAWALAGKSYAGEEWFQKTMSGGYYISDVFLGYRNVPHFVVAVRRIDKGRTWVLRATIDTLFFDTLVSGVRMGTTGEAYILNYEGLAQTARRSGNLAVLDPDPAFDWFENKIKFGNKATWFSPEDQPFLYAVTGLSDKSWYLVVRQEKQDAYGALYSAAVICLIVTVCGLAALVVTAVFISERIVRRIELLDTEKEALGSQLIRAVQLAEIGEMAAGFAHEINNPLQIIKSEYALLKILVGEAETADGGPDRSPAGSTSFSEINEGLDQIHTQVERCNKITSAVLKFGRKNDTRQTALDPKSLIPEILGLVENTARSGGIDLTTRIDEDTPMFMGDHSRFQQVMLNLINNALDAVAKHHGARGGRVEILAGQIREKNRALVEIRVQDNGCGIRPDHMNKIFTPFFTTKAVGRGTGLGLSVCFGIIESFGGTMDVDSRPGQGTVFAVRLPAK